MGVIILFCPILPLNHHTSPSDIFIVEMLVYLFLVEKDRTFAHYHHISCPVEA